MLMTIGKPAAAEVVPEGPSFASLFATRIMWGTLVGTFCYNYFTYFSMTWLPAYFVERRHLSLTSMGGQYGQLLGMATVSIVAGFAADWLIRRGFDAVTTRRWFVIAGFLVASTEVIGALSDSNEVAKIFAIVSLAGLGLATGIKADPDADAGNGQVDRRGRRIRRRRGRGRAVLYCG